jgi:uncharacterized protein YbjT (DUF2867 family)
MRVLVAEANGQIGQHLVRLLAGSRQEVRTMVRSEDQAQLMRDLGGDPLVADLEGDAPTHLSFRRKCISL